MSDMYGDDDLLSLSGIQHMAFCERQWALIHIEQQWAESVRTVEGRHLHERTDDPFFDETRVNRRIVRSVPLVTRHLGLQGVADMVEFWRDDSLSLHDGITLSGTSGRWRPKPVEYKRGRPKPDDRDAVQLCAQAMALEEMLGVCITEGDIYYHQTRHREAVSISASLRERTAGLAYKMHLLFAEGVTPVAVIKSHCSLCSLEHLCLPDLAKRRNKVADYLKLMQTNDF